MSTVGRPADNADSGPACKEDGYGQFHIKLPAESPACSHSQQRSPLLLGTAQLLLRQRLPLLTAESGFADVLNRVRCSVILHTAEMCSGAATELGPSNCYCSCLPSGNLSQSHNSSIAAWGAVSPHMRQHALAFQLGM